MLYIHGTGHFHPENVIDNAFLESLDIGTNNEWILERVGIRTRRTVMSLDYIRETHNRNPMAALEASAYTDSQMAARAAAMAVERAGLKMSDIGLVISGGCSSMWSLPAEACRIAAELELDVPAFDLNSGCSTFGTILHWVNAMKAEATPPYILVCTPEASTRVQNYDDRNSAVLFGDCAAAAVVSLSVPARARVLTSSMASDPKGHSKVYVRAGEYFGQEGKSVQGFAIRRTVSCFKELRKAMTTGADDLYFIGHQANLLVLQGVCHYTNLDDDHHLRNVEEFGNCAAAGAPAVLSQNWDGFKDGDDLGLVVVGAGLSWSSLHIQFGDSPTS